MSPAPSLVTSHPLLDEVLSAWTDALGADAGRYRGHAYRVFNFARALGPIGSTRDDDALATAAAFHDLGIWSDATFDYLAPSARRASAFLATNAHGLDAGAVTRMIELHHKLTRCSPEDGALAEAFRRADLADVSLGVLAAGLPRAFVREVQATFPNAGFHAMLLRVGARWIVRHPTRPLPMMRW